MLYMQIDTQRAILGAFYVSHDIKTHAKDILNWAEFQNLEDSKYKEKVQ